MSAAASLLFMRGLTLFVLLAVGFSGCINGADSEPEPIVAAPAVDVAPFLNYTPVDPDMALSLVMEDLQLPGTGGVSLHARITRPDGPGPYPVIVQHTPYTAPGCNVAFYDGAVEPPVAGCAEGTFEREFARRGYAYVHADLRGTGDSDGCLDLRGPADIADIGALADGLAAQPWSNGNVGFIGASYPGSTSHMAALSGSPAVKAVIPVVASTSFYHYHHNDGVPYNGNHALGGTNAGYTQQGLTPTFNPLTGLAKVAEQPLCPHVENAVMHGGLDQSGDYYSWWQERNLRPLAGSVTVPVMMAQGLADWNVKPDHVANWFNDIQSESKTFIGGQWGHAYPASGDGACVPQSDVDLCTAPWGSWWAYAAAFFDTYLKEIDTGMFNGSVAWVQDNNRTWHRSADFPIKNAPVLDMFIHGDGTIQTFGGKDVSMIWYACPNDEYNRGTAAGAAEDLTIGCNVRTDQQLVFTSEPAPADFVISGVPTINLTVDTGGRTTHLVVVMDIVDSSGTVVRSRENYGYLNPIMRDEIDSPKAVPTGPYDVMIDFYTQEDVIKKGERIQLTLRSDDGGRTIEFFDEGTVMLSGQPVLHLPLRPIELQGTRLAQ